MRSGAQGKLLHPQLGSACARSQGFRSTLADKPYLSKRAARTTEGRTRRTAQGLWGWGLSPPPEPPAKSTLGIKPMSLPAPGSALALMVVPQEPGFQRKWLLTDTKGSAQQVWGKGLSSEVLWGRQINTTRG